MIFVTVGAQMPFDRLIEMVDDWAVTRERDDVFAQIGFSEYRARRIRTERFLASEQFMDHVAKADCIVAHAGMGTILTALQNGKPLLVMPRLAELHETRNDHQVPTAKHFAAAGHVLAAYGRDELMDALDRLEAFRPATVIGPKASPRLLERVRDFAWSDGKGR